MAVQMRRINFDKLVGKMWKRMARTLAQEEKEKGTSMYDLDTITRRVSGAWSHLTQAKHERVKCK